MSILDEVTALLEAADLTVHTGYPPTGARVPYVVQRPLLVDDIELAVSGDALGWDYQTSLYCCGGSVEASFNLALVVMVTLHGQRAGGTTLAASTGYVGAPVEGHYETQVTVQLNQGGI